MIQKTHDDAAPASPSSHSGDEMGAMKDPARAQFQVEPTCRITETVSITKTPPMMITSRNSWRTSTAMVPSAPPRAREPTSPGEHLGWIGVEPEENPRPAPDDGGTDDHQLGGVGNVGDVQVVRKLTLPVAQAIRGKAPATITVGMMASPSRPSVRLTALRCRR